VFITHLDIYYVYIHHKNDGSRNTKHLIVWDGEVARPRLVSPKAVVIRRLASLNGCRESWRSANSCVVHSLRIMSDCQVTSGVSFYPRVQCRIYSVRCGSKVGFLPGTEKLNHPSVLEEFNTRTLLT
jgi:hypothetical protein